MAGKKYDAEAIEILENKDAVRRRPGMYIGGTGKEGYHHLLWEIVDNSIDEAINGHASEIKVTLDGKTARVEDNGRGIPVAKHPKRGVSTLEVVLTSLHAGGKFGGGQYGAAGGLHGVGAAVVNFLSQRLEVEVRRGGEVYVQEYERGESLREVERVGKCAKSDTGTVVVFTPDPDIFGTEISFDPETVRETLEIKTYLHKGLRIILECGDETFVLQQDEGVKGLVGSMVGGEAKPIHKSPIEVEGEAGPVRIDIAFQWTEGTQEKVRSFVNTIPTRNGGTHENGFKTGVVSALRSYIEIRGDVPKTLRINAEDIREGIVAAVSVFYDGDLEFEGQTKERLNNTEVAPIVMNEVRTAVEQYLLSNTTTADDIVERVVRAARAREASRATVSVTPRKRNTKKLVLPGKLADCISNDPVQNEIFIVEGDSAAGTGRQARNRRTQAILPLRGKILNTEAASAKAILNNKEIQAIIEALGCGWGEAFDIRRLRYHKIILLMDADSDGHHITTLLLTFFYRHMPEIVEKGHLFIAQPPLYKIETSDETYWAASDEERDVILEEVEATDITRYKGLGEMMSATLKETTLDPETRRILPVTVTDENITDHVIRTLLGRRASGRYEFIVENIKDIDSLDV